MYQVHLNNYCNYWRVRTLAMKREHKVMTTLKLPATLEKEMLYRIIEEGYGMRGKSRWVTEAIEQFLLLENFWEYVQLAEDIENLTQSMSIRLPELIAQKLEDARIKVRNVYPGIEGVKSLIIRASILQRLIRQG